MKQKMLRFFLISLAFIGLSGKIMADTAQEIANYINSATYGDLTAVVSGNTVTVTSTPGVTATPNNTDFLKFSIDGGVTVIWKATLNGTPSSNFSLINISGGSGVFEMQSGSITNSGTGRAITNNSASEIRISGGTMSATGCVVYNSAGTLNVFSGMLSAVDGYAIYNASIGTVNVSGGTVSATNAISNSGTINISAGTVSATSGCGIYNSGTVNISGGIVSAANGKAINNGSNVYSGTVTISGSAIITSTNTAFGSGTIYNAGHNFLNIANNVININGGTVENTSSGFAIFNNYGIVNVNSGIVQASSSNAIRNESPCTINISGGTIETTNADAIYNSYKINILGGTVSTSGSGRSAINSTNGTATITGGTISAIGSNSFAVNSTSNTTIILGGNPTIMGRIYTYSQGLSVFTDGIDLFAPGSKIYTLDFPTNQYNNSTIAVIDGRNFLANFALYSLAWKLLPSGAHLAMEPSGVGIAETNNDSSLRVYPNPTTGQLTIESGELKVENVEIFDVFGKKVFEQKAPLTVLQSYDITVLSAGVYFVKISTEKGEVIKKVLKE